MNEKAFPITNEICIGEIVSKCNAGIDLRDYFAARAMQGEISTQSTDNGFYNNLPYLAERCYLIADAMMEARKK